MPNGRPGRLKWPAGSSWAACFTSTHILSHLGLLATAAHVVRRTEIGAFRSACMAAHVVRRTEISTSRSAYHGDMSRPSAKIGNVGECKSARFCALNLSHLVPLGPLSGLCPTRTGRLAPLREVPAMKSEALKQTLRLITKVFTNPRVGPDQRDQLQRAKRELEAVARSGKVDERKIYRATEIVATVLLQIVECEATQRSE